MEHPTDKTGIATAVTPDQPPAPEQQSTKEAIDDGVVTARLRARLNEDPVTNAYLIQVETFHSTVVLSGYVELAKVRIRALEIAREIAGANAVKDSLEIREI